MSEPQKQSDAPEVVARDAAETDTHPVEPNPSPPRPAGQARTPRRVTVRDHQHFRETGEPPHLDDEDLAFILDHPPARRSASEAKHVLDILDELDREATEGRKT